MDLFNRKNLVIRRTHQSAICTHYSPDCKTSIAEVFIRNHNGIHYLNQPFTAVLPASDDLYYQTYRRGLYSPRPYHLALISDESVFYCVVALAVSCCKAWNLDAVRLVRDADPDARLTDTDLLEIKALARWQDTAFPGTWNSPVIVALALALDDTGCAPFADQIRKHTFIKRGY